MSKPRLSKPLQRYIEQIREKAGATSYELVRFERHPVIRFYGTDGASHVQAMPATPSDKRGWLNTVRDVRRGLRSPARLPA